MNNRLPLKPQTGCKSSIITRSSKGAVMTIYKVLITDVNHKAYGVFNVKGKRKLHKFMMKYAYKYKIQLL